MKVHKNRPLAGGIYFRQIPGGMGRDGEVYSDSATLIICDTNGDLTSIFNFRRNEWRSLKDSPVLAFDPEDEVIWFEE